MRVNRNLCLKRGTDSLLLEFELLHQLLDAQPLLLQPVLLLPKSSSHWAQKISTRAEETCRRRLRTVVSVTSLLIQLGLQRVDGGLRGGEHASTRDIGMGMVTNLQLLQLLFLRLILLLLPLQLQPSLLLPLSRSRCVAVFLENGVCTRHSFRPHHGGRIASHLGHGLGATRCAAVAVMRNFGSAGKSAISSLRRKLAPNVGFCAHGGEMTAKM